MKLSIKRYIENDLNHQGLEAFQVSNTNLLKALIEIKNSIDNSLTFRSGCKSGVCGSCAIRVNGVERLACKTIINDGDIVEAINNTEIIKDLVVDVSHETLLIKRSNSFLEKNSEVSITSKEVAIIDNQSNCILCNICYSSCPVYSVNKEFLGPFALTRALRYINDKKVANTDSIIASIQDKGIWDCTLCSACTFVCPQGIDSKNDIFQLQNISMQKGYTNPNQMNFDSNMNFGMEDMGFDPNGSF